MAARLFMNMRKSWDAYLKRLGEANRKNFGSGSLDCCKLNEYENDGKHQRHIKHQI